MAIKLGGKAYLPGHWWTHFFAAFLMHDLVTNVGFLTMFVLYRGFKNRLR